MKTTSLARRRAPLRSIVERFTECPWFIWLDSSRMEIAEAAYYRGAEPTPFAVHVFGTALAVVDVFRVVAIRAVCATVGHDTVVENGSRFCFRCESLVGGRPW